MNQQQINQLSEDLLYNVKFNKESRLMINSLTKVDISLLKNDQQKKAFWINIYNAFYLILRKKGFAKPEIYKEKLITIASEALSLDDIEHGILRRFRYKYSFGFFPSLMVSKFIKDNVVDALDYRIHFALNCGAKSCPPIAFYTSDKIDSQLNLATQSFLSAESEFNDAEKEIHTTALFKWYYADFGKQKGIKNIFLQQLGKDVFQYKIKFKPYSWEDDLGNFVS